VLVFFILYTRLFHFLIYTHNKDRLKPDGLYQFN